MLDRRALLSWMVCATGALGLPRRADASIARAVALEDLCRMSRVALVATGLAAESQWETIGGTRRIVTTTRMQVDDVVAGRPMDSEVLVRTLGGQVGDIGQIVHGEAVLLLGERAVVFVADGGGGALHVTAMAQGHYPVRKAAGDVERLALSPRSAELKDPKSDAAVLRLRGQPIAEAQRRITTAWNRAHR